TISTGNGHLGAFVRRITLGNDPHGSGAVVDLVNAAAVIGSRNSAAISAANHTRDRDVLAVITAWISLKLGDRRSLRTGGRQNGHAGNERHREDLCCSGHPYLLYLLKIEREEILDLKIQFWLFGFARICAAAISA